MKTKYLNILLFLFSLITLVNCTHADLAPKDNPNPEPPAVPTYSETDLVAKKVTTPPTIDGTVDAVWDDAVELRAQAKVPDPGNDVFKGYVDDVYNGTLKALYDDQYIYILAQWDDNNEDLSRDTWYFDPNDSRWHQESNKPVFNAQGVKIRNAFYEDKFAMQWNISSTNNWDTKTCYATCHTGLTEAEGFARHYTTIAGEQTDMWHWKSVRTGFPTNQFDDKHVIDNVNNPINKTRAGDEKTSGGHVNNRVTLKLDGTGADVTVPKYYIPGRENYYWILDSEVADGTAKEIVAVASDGKLTDQDGTIIDPVTDTRYQRDGSFVGSFCMPSITTGPFVGSRGDITCGQSYTGNGWILEIKRKLNTTHSDDVVFDTSKDYPFGFAIFNNAAIAHGIKPYLTLKFEK